MKIDAAVTTIKRRGGFPQIDVALKTGVIGISISFDWSDGTDLSAAAVAPSRALNSIGLVAEHSLEKGLEQATDAIDIAIGTKTFAKAKCEIEARGLSI